MSVLGAARVGKLDGQANSARCTWPNTTMNWIASAKNASHEPNLTCKRTRRIPARASDFSAEADAFLALGKASTTSLRLIGGRDQRKSHASGRPNPAAVRDSPMPNSRNGNFRAQVTL